MATAEIDTALALRVAYLIEASLSTGGSPSISDPIPLINMTNSEASDIARILREYAEGGWRSIETAQDGTVYVVVSGFTGTGKSGVMGEIEIALKAIGLEVSSDAEFQAEKRMTHADWQEALDLYKPRVVLQELNIRRHLPAPPDEI